MQLENNLWLVGGYYVDRDHAGQVRIVGSQNHLYYGSTGLYNDDIAIQNVQEVRGEIQVTLQLQPRHGFIPDPAMGHIRRVRSYIQAVNRADRTFEEVERDHPGELRPAEISSETTDNGTVVHYLRRYGPHYYGVRLTWPDGSKLYRDEERHGFRIEAEGPIEVVLTTTTDVPAQPYAGHILKPPHYDVSLIEPKWQTYADRLLKRTTAEIEHLVRYGKTSGFDYGTLFPRDWMESADLLAEDLTPSALRYMYTESLRHVSDNGAGWHEDIVGEFKYERQQEINHLARSFDDFISPEHPLSPQFRQLLGHLDELFITRHMIDIEPRYLLGLRLIPPDQFDGEDLGRLRQVARFVTTKAEAVGLITFNKLALPFRRQRGDEYYSAGNWRDSELAFKQIDPIIAPFDVNAVFYPQALRLISRHHKILGADPKQLERLIVKWDAVRERYRFTNKDGTTAFALALYGGGPDTPSQTMRINHLDEASDLFYGQPTEADVASFARRILSPDYFYTPSGPLLVGRHQGYDHSQYHGEVIWAKQAAFAAAGLERSIERAHREHWTDETQRLLHDALRATVETSLQAFHDLDATPELHYDDHGRARLYVDQPAPEGVMNMVQLWSAAGARRILRSLLSV
jgi:hypothetical protein